MVDQLANFELDVGSKARQVRRDILSGKPLRDDRYGPVNSQRAAELRQFRQLTYRILMAPARFRASRAA